MLQKPNNPEYYYIYYITFYCNIYYLIYVLHVNTSNVKIDENRRF